MRTVQEPERRILEALATHPAHNVLVRDGADRRWYLYEFAETPPNITDVRQDVAESLVEEGYVEYLDQDRERRKELPDDYDVYALSDSGKRQAQNRS